MTEIKCKTMKIGGSLGIILPKDIVEKEDLGPRQTIRVKISRQVKVKDVFGFLSDWKTPTQKLKDEVRRGW